MTTHMLFAHLIPCLLALLSAVTVTVLRIREKMFDRAFVLSYDATAVVIAVVVWFL